MTNDTVKELGEPTSMTVDEFMRVLIGQMFENDNRTSYLHSKLMCTDGSESELEFRIVIESINGIKTSEDEE